MGRSEAPLSTEIQGRRLLEKLTEKHFSLRGIPKMLSHAEVYTWEGS